MNYVRSISWSQFKNTLNLKNHKKDSSSSCIDIQSSIYLKVTEGNLGMWGSCYSIFSCMCIFCRSLLVLLSFFAWPLCCLSFFYLRIRITLWYFQTLLAINIQEEFTATFTDIAFYIRVLDRNATQNIYLTLKCLKRDVFYVNENKQRYNKKILYYNTI